MAYNPYPQQSMYGGAYNQYQQRVDNTPQWQQSQPNTQQQSIINGRAVTGVEEAVASQIPLDGSVSVFTDFSHGKIYTKQLNYQDGSAIFKTYALEQPTQATEQTNSSMVEYAPMSEVDALKAKIDRLEAIVSDKPKTKGAVDK